jgi:hypothetical protein
MHTPRYSSDMALPAALAGLLILGILLSLGLRPPPARPAIAPEDEFSAERAIGILQHLLAEGVPHPVGTPANFVVRDRIIERLTSYGYAVDVQRTFACRAHGGMCAPVENIITRLPGSDGAARAVMLTSHYDSRGAGPGAADAGAAVAAILEVARIIRSEAPFHNDVILLLTDGEEAGLLGAEAFVAEHPWAADVGVVINLEARGTSGPSIMFETSENNRWLVREFARAVRRPVANSLTYDVYRLLPNDTDATVYKREGIAAINFAFIGELAHYHTALDDIAQLNERTVQHHGDNALAMVRRFANSRLEPQPGDAVYADFFGVALLHWPAAWTLPAAVLFLLTVIACSLMLIRRAQLQISALFWALLVTVLALAAAVGLGFGIGTLLTRVTGRPGVLHAWPGPALLALWLGAVTLVLSAGTFVARRAGFWALFAASWLVITLLAAAMAARLPGASVVLFIPAAVGATAMAIAVFGGPEIRRYADVAAIAAALGTGFSLIPLALLLYSAFLLQLPFAISAVIGIAALPLLPLLATRPSAMRVQRIGLACAAVVAGAAIVLSLLVPGYSTHRPRPMNMVYAQEGERAWWAVRGLDITAASLPADMHQVAPFTDDLPPALPPTGRGPSAPATPLELPQPALELLSFQPLDESGGVSLMLGMEPTRQGNRMAIVAPVGSRLRVHQRPVNGLRSIVPGSTTWIILGVPSDGIMLEIALPAGATREVIAYDFAPGLPPAASALVRSRPATAVPFGDGDVTVTSARLRVPEQW